MLTQETSFCTSCGTRIERRVEGPSPAAMEDRRRISVLFVDLVDFTPYSERSDPELVRGLQTDFFATARRVIGQYGGVVEKYIGDAVMALFGAPVATETDALRCVRAGLELQRVLARFAAGGDGGPRFRVGVATGEAIVDLAAARDGGQAIVAGDVVNMASRMQAVAPHGGVLVCGNTHALTVSGIEYEAHPPVILRGRTRPTEVWLARSVVQARHPDLDADRTPLVNRQHELGLLVNALHRSLQDRMPQLVTIFGRAGIGKSRLVRELYRHAGGLVNERVTWRTGHCPPFGENVAFAALADIVKAEAGILDTDSAEVAADRLAAAIGELVNGQPATAPASAPGPAAPASEAPRVGLSPTEAKRLIDALRPLVGLPGPKLPAEEAASAWRRFLVASAARRPTVLVFEDLHWADDTMLRFIELLGASAHDVPLLLLCTTRPELIDRDPGWAGTMGGSLTITLPPLRDSGITELFLHLFNQERLATMLGPLVELAGGNPLYAHEYVRMLKERGVLRPSGSGWSLGDDPALPMPDSVHAVIANRVDLLETRDRTVLLAAAVVGMQFWPGAVAAALGRPVESVERALRRLEQRDFVYEQIESTMAGQAEYRFRHVLVRDVCYQRLPRTARAACHERTADWLDTLSGGRDTDLAEVLAHHRWAAHEIARTLGASTERYAVAARVALHRAARRAYAVHALDAAAAHAARAMGLYEAEPNRVDRLELELLATEIAFYRDEDGFLAGGGKGRISGLAERLQAQGERARAARALTLLSQVAWVSADRATAWASLDRAVELFETLPDSADKADAYAEKGRLHMLSLERDGAIAAAEIAAAIAERLGLLEVQANARITSGTARYQAGDPTALADLEAVADFCREHRLVALRRATQNLAWAVLQDGDWPRSQELLAESQATLLGGQSLTTGYSTGAMRACFNGDFDRLLAEADAFVDTPTGRWDLWVRGLRWWVRTLRGEPFDPAAEADLADALGLARDSGFHRPRWSALAAAALCRALHGRRREAADLLAELIETWRPIPALPSGEWISAAAYAAALSGRESAVELRAVLGALEHHTPWTSAALATVNAAVAGADGDHARAGRLYATAAELYAGIPDVTSRMLGLALAARHLTLADADATAEAEAEAEVEVEVEVEVAQVEPAGATVQLGVDGSAAEVLATVQAFARRNHAPGLLALADAAKETVAGRS